VLNKNGNIIFKRTSVFNVLNFNLKHLFFILVIREYNSVDKNITLWVFFFLFLFNFCLSFKKNDFILKKFRDFFYGILKKNLKLLSILK
jgi:hypothetical protein